jgi:hypothetical protein
VISDQRRGADRGGAAAERGNEAKDQQAFERRRGHAADRRQDVNGEAHVDRALPAEAVEQRAVNDLSEREADEVHRHAERHTRHRDVQIRSDLRERRQVQVDREGRQGIEDAEHHDQHGGGMSFLHVRSNQSGHCTKRQILWYH